ncbi:MAG: DUF7144 family membrane protein [Acidimicrobiia bacterium]
MNEQRTAWTGWIVFASVLMMITGALNAFSGIVAVVSKNWFVWSNQTNLYMNFTAWGWTHFAIGCLVFLAGLGLLTGNIWARAAAVLFASISLIGNFLWLPSYPFWALTVMVLDALIIYAVCAHGGEMKVAAPETIIDVTGAPTRPVVQPSPSARNETRAGVPKV